MNERGNLLVVRNDRLGDTILALPTIPLLRQAFPGAKIYFWAAPQVAPLVMCVDGIEDVLESGDHASHTIAEKLRSLRIETAFCLRPTFSNAKALKKARIPERIGTARRWYSFLFNKRIDLPRRGSQQHEADLNLDLLTAVGVKGDADFPEIILPENVEEKIGQLLAGNPEASGSQSSYIVIHPGSGGSTQNWSSKYFKEIAARLAVEHSWEIVVTGSPSEEDLCREVASDHCLNLCGKTDLLELTALLKQTELLITNSTGPLHLAVALGTIVIGLYPPLADSMPDRWGPYGHPEWAMMPDLPVCRKCHNGDFSACKCMEELSPDSVYQRAIELLDVK